MPDVLGGISRLLIQIAYVRKIPVESGIIQSVANGEKLAEGFLTEQDATANAPGTIVHQSFPQDAQNQSGIENISATFSGSREWW